MNSNITQKIPAYNDSFNETLSEGIFETVEGYRYRTIDEIMMPPYVTERRYEHSRTIQTRSDDICFGSYPKSGSTWLSQIILLLLNGGKNPDNGSLREHMIWAESSWPYPIPVDQVESIASPRIFKSHMPYQMAVGGDPKSQPAKYIYILRNPKDVCVSYYHFETGKAWAGDFDCSWDRWFELFLDGQVQRGNWFDHVLSWWNQRDLSNLLIMKYEDLLLDFNAHVQRLAGYLDIDLPTEMLSEVKRLSSFEAMKASEFSNMHQVEQLETFYRKGKIGSWRKHFSAEQDARFNEVTEQRLGSSELTFAWTHTS